MDFVGLSIMNLIQRHPAKADVMSRLIVPREEHAAEPPRILEGPETTRKG